MQQLHILDDSRLEVGLSLKFENVQLKMKHFLFARHPRLILLIICQNENCNKSQNQTKIRRNFHFVQYQPPTSKLLFITSMFPTEKIKVNTISPLAAQND